jgi:hypothetical protein
MPVQVLLTGIGTDAHQQGGRCEGEKQEALHGDSSVV